MAESHTADPANVSSPNRTTGTSATPAGSATKLRMTGTSLLTNTPQGPWRAYQASARSRSCVLTSTYLPQRSTKARPPVRPTNQAMNAPTSSPATPATMAPGKDSLPSEASTPAKPSVSSEEVGMQHDWATERTKTAA